MAIIGAHTIIYASDVEAALAFFRDVLEFPHVDAGGGRLFFRAPPSEIAVHETATVPDPARHELYLMCDDIETTVTDLRAKGVALDDDVRDLGWGLLISVPVPGAGTIGIYQPRHLTAYDLDR